MERTSAPFDVDPLTGEKLQTMDRNIPLSLEELSLLKSDFSDDAEAKKAIENQALGGIFGQGRNQAGSDFTGDKIIGTEESRANSPFGKTMGSSTGKVAMRSIIDVLDRMALQPSLESDALFRAFGRQAGTANETTRGVLGSDIFSDVERGRTADKLRKRNDARDERIKALLDRIGA